MSRHPLRVTVAVTAVTATCAASLWVAGWQDGPRQPGTIAARPVTEPSPSREPPVPRANPPLTAQPSDPRQPAPMPPPDGPVPGAPAPQPAPEFLSWAIMDLPSGTIAGSDNLAATSTTASMIKVWLVADLLRRHIATGDDPSPQRLDQLSLIVRDSDNELTNELFDELGRHASIERLITTCGLTDAAAVPDSWSNTLVSARDAARIGACLADGTALAGDQRWTAWLLDEMRAVRGLGDFGIRHALPAADRPSVAIKNGWVDRTAEQSWHVSCLAVGDGWTMAVLTRYPLPLAFEHGAGLCRSTAERHLLPRLG